MNKTVTFRTLLSCLSLIVECVTVCAVEGNTTMAYNFIRSAGTVMRSGRRVFGGAPAQLSELPGVCALATGARRVSCSGALLHARWALTAAHCVSADVALVLYGTASPEVAGVGGVADVHSQYRHPKYRVVEEWRGGWDVVGLQHDVGLVRTHQRMAPGDALLLHTLQLYDPETMLGSEIRVLGFGRTELGSPGERLMGAALQLVPCSRGSYEHCVCARAPGGDERAVCAGDSGGPVLYRGALVGVTSMGPAECGAVAGVPATSVITVTRRYSDLIANTVRDVAPRMRRVHPAAALRVRPRALHVLAVLGFGRTELGSPGERLMGAALQLVPCSRGSYEHCVCARAPGGDERAVCAGDSGGPVLYRGALVGVTSMGPAECGAVAGVPATSVITVTRRYSDLIANTVRDVAPRMRRVHPAAALRVRPRALHVLAVLVMFRT